MRRPWCPATRILEHRENERLNADADAKKKSGQSGAALGDTGNRLPARRDDFDPMPEGDRVWQKNEGERATVQCVFEGT
jgi:protein TilB